MNAPVDHTALSIPVLETDRLRLRAPKPADFEPMAQFRASDRSKTVGGPHSRNHTFDWLCAIAGHWLMRGYGRWIIADRDTDVTLGVGGLMFPEGWPEPEIAWSLTEQAEGRGIAFEAALAARRFAYDTLGWSTVVSCTTPDNTRSIALAKRMGATRDGAHTHPDLGTLLIWRHPGPEALT